MKYLILILFLSSCSIVYKAKDSELVLKDYQAYTDQDYLDFLASEAFVYLKSSETKVTKLSASDLIYIDKLVSKIKSTNSVLFDEKNKTHLHIISDETPFHFSLPGGHLFFSSGVFTKYIQTESLLLCVLTYELIRSERNLYKRFIKIPTGDISSKDLLVSQRLDVNQKIKIHKFAFKVLNSLEIDTDTYLSWLQIQNRNSEDFSLQVGDIGSVSREEALFRSFIIENSNYNTKRKFKRSSKDFYSLLKVIRDRS